MTASFLFLFLFSATEIFKAIKKFMFVFDERKDKEVQSHV